MQRIMIPTINAVAESFAKPAARKNNPIRVGAKSKKAATFVSKSFPNIGVS